MNPHYKDKTFSRQSYPYSGNLYIWKNGLYIETESYSLAAPSNHPKQCWISFNWAWRNIQVSFTGKLTISFHSWKYIWSCRQLTTGQFVQAPMHNWQGWVSMTYTYFSIPTTFTVDHGHSDRCIIYSASLTNAWTLSVSLHSPNGRQMPAVGAVQEDCQWNLKNCVNCHRWHEPKIHCDWSNLDLYLDQAVTKGVCQPTEDHGSYPTLQSQFRQARTV